MVFAWDCAWNFAWDCAWDNEHGHPVYSGGAFPVKVQPDCDPMGFIPAYKKQGVVIAMNNSTNANSIVRTPKRRV